MDAFAALADPTRRGIVERLAATGPQRIADLSAGFDMSRQALTKHLDILDRAGVLESELRGRERFNWVAEDAFEPIRDWLRRYDRFWDERLAELKRLAEDEANGGNK
jgi:DNA-binding transcriptional ArsR family regulator